MTWLTKFEIGTASDNPKEVVAFWVVEQDTQGFACYSEESALFAAKILNRYEDIRQSVHKIDLSIQENNIYKTSTKSK